ncbi:MAG: hypothetical protein GY857_11905 [Desulfobacula sp.]|nr:hypothetical protein [Desulfobacula sp.]
MAFAQSSTDLSRQPLHVVSDKMIAKEDSSMVEFIGNVKAEQEDSTIFADSIKIYFTPDEEKTDKSKEKSDTQSNVKKIISTGNVKFISEERKAYADKAVYTTIDDLLVLTGESPKLITGSSFVTGKKITLFRQQGRVIVESNGAQRVEALFNPEDNVTKDANNKNSGKDKQ